MTGVRDVEMPVSIIIFQHPADNVMKNNSRKKKFNSTMDLDPIRIYRRTLWEKENDLYVLVYQGRGSQQDNKAAV